MKLLTLTLILLILFIASCSTSNLSVSTIKVHNRGENKVLSIDKGLTNMQTVSPEVSIYLHPTLDRQTAFISICNRGNRATYTVKPSRTRTKTERPVAAGLILNKTVVKESASFYEAAQNDSFLNGASTFSIYSMICAILAIILISNTTLAIIFGIAAILFGIAAEEYSGSGQAGILLGFIAIFFAFKFWFF